MLRNNLGIPTRKRILAVCVKMFLEQGYKKTTLSQIQEKARVSCSSFQNIFRAKDGVLTELVKFMFGSQFGMAREITGEQLPPVYEYAVETAIQLALTEWNENLREIYIEAYTQEEASAYIHQQTAKELHRIFGKYQPELTERDFYILDIGSKGVMCSYMAYSCDAILPFPKKLEHFMRTTLCIYRVPEKEQDAVISFLMEQNIREIAEKVMQKLFQALAMQYEFSLQGVELTLEEEMKG